MIGCLQMCADKLPPYSLHLLSADSSLTAVPWQKVFQIAILVPGLPNLHFSITLESPYYQCIYIYLFDHWP